MLDIIVTLLHIVEDVSFGALCFGLLIIAGFIYYEWRNYGK